MSSPPAPHSTFRTVVIVTSTVAGILFLLAVPAVIRYGDRLRDFGWIAARSNGVLVVGRVDPVGPAAGLLQEGDRVLAWDGDRRVMLVSTALYRRMLPADAGYTLTVQRGGVEQTVALAAPAVVSSDPWRVSISSLVVALVWFVVATMIALFRPELSVSRSAYAAGMVMGFFMLGMARGIALPWLPGWWRNALLLAFPFVPLHVAIGYDFYVRFPHGISTPRFWRLVRNVMYVVCGALCLTGQLMEVVLTVVAPDRVVPVFVWLSPIDQWLSWPAGLVYPVGGLAIVAVVTRNYRAVQREDDRRRLRWVVWGTVLGLLPFLVLQMMMLGWRIVGTPMNAGRWMGLVNLATGLIPIAFGYAIIKHHVFDITFVVRRGLQYLLAKNALHVLLALPIAGLAYGVFVNRGQPIEQLLRMNSWYLYLIAAAVVSLRFRSQLSHWLDRRFFREAHDRQRILVDLIDNVEKLESASSVSKLVSHELEAVFHPQCMFVWYSESDKQNLTLSYSSGGYIHAAELAPNSPLLRLAERASGIIELPLREDDALPGVERAWLEEAGVRLIVPMIGTDRRLVGLLMLGDKKSDEAYSSDDLKLLQAIARQIAVARENARLKERVDEDRRLRHDVLAHLATGAVNVLKECPACGTCYDAGATACASDGTELVLSLPVERTIDGKYRLDRLLGKGGMGAVYEAADLRLARSVAVKIMLGRAFGDRQALRRFEREAQTCARLTHPNIITIFDFGGVGADGAFLVMELVQGRTLRAELSRRGHLPPALTAAWFTQLCEGVAAAHHSQVIHRDLKPENVLIARTATGGETLKVLDFGLAKALTADEAGGALTHPGVVLGTAGYMAPEQLSGGSADHRADIFAIGVMAAEAIVGERPFKGRSYNELLASISKDVVTLGGEGAELRRLEAVLRRATAPDPAQRYGSIAELVADLIPALHAIPAPVSDPDAQTTILS